jgi:hypothetical protein
MMPNIFRESSKIHPRSGVCCSCWRFEGCKLWLTVVLPTLRLLRGRVSAGFCLFWKFA